MMARMSELSRRAILRLGVGAAAGAAGAYALGSALHTQSASVAGPPVSMTSAGAPLAPPAPLEPAACRCAADVRARLVRLRRARRSSDELGDRPPARPVRAAASGHRAARQGQGRRGRDCRRCRAGLGAGRRGGHAAVRGRRGRRRRELLAQARVGRGLRRDGARRTDPDAGVAGPRHLTGRLPGLVDGRLRRTAARRAASARHAPPRSAR